MKQHKYFIVDILFVLALFGVFTLSALMLVSIGAEVYRHTASDMSENYEIRTSVSYITEKIRQNDLSCSSENISISEFSDTYALTLSQDVEGEIYYTHLYLHDGYLKELFTRSGGYLGEGALSAGQNIMKLSAFTPEQVAENLFAVHFTMPEGESHTIFISTHSSP